MDVIKEGLLKVDPGLLVWTLFTFLVLLLILWKAAWKPLVEALDSRAERVRSDIEKADKAREEAESLLEQHKEMVAKANEEASSIIAKSRDEAEKLKNDIVVKANQEARDIADRTKREIEAAKDKALDELKSEIVTLSTEIASKIVVKNINPDDQKDLVKDALAKLETVQ
jgi:F-type H+-transporting ATPase subunit b